MKARPYKAIYLAKGLGGLAQVMTDIAIDFADELPSLTIVNTDDWETPYKVLVTSQPYTAKR